MTPESHGSEIVYDAAWRFYLLLALFDRRDGTGISDLVRMAREAYEREDEVDAWEQFDALWNRLTSSESEMDLWVDLVPESTPCTCNFEGFVHAEWCDVMRAAVALRDARGEAK